MSPFVTALAIVAQSASAVPAPNDLTSGFFTHCELARFRDQPSQWTREALVGLSRSGVDPTLEGLVLVPSGTGRPNEAWIELSPLTGLPFREAFVSWNAFVPSGAGLVVELRVAELEGAWSPWLRIGASGVTAPGAIDSFEGGRLDTDCFRSERTWQRAQVRVSAWRAEEGSARVRLENVALVVVDRTLPIRSVEGLRRANANPGGACTLPMPAPDEQTWPRRLDVPFRSQTSLARELAPRACSPTSLAMVLAYRGVDVPTERVAELAYDREHDLYGNWPRNVQAAFELGVSGWLLCFSDWTSVENEIVSGQPLVISIAAKEGELTGAPYAKTSGHLLVLTGFDAKGDVFVNDPAAIDAEHGQLTYERAELERCWMGHGGVAYVLLPRRDATR